MTAGKDSTSVDLSNASAERGKGRHLRASLRKLAGTGALLVVFAVVWRFTPLRSYMSDFHRFKDDLDRMGFWAPFVFTIVSGFFIAVGISRLIFCAIAGAAFGFIEGVLCSEAAALLGAYACFLYARWIGGNWVRRRLRGSDKLGELVRRNALAGTILVRQLPIGGIVLNLALGLSAIPHSTFLLGSAIGFLPEGIIATLLGSGSVKGSLSHAVWQIGAALVIGGALVWILWQFRTAAVSRELETEIEHIGEESDGKP